MYYELNATLPVDGVSNITVHVRDSLGGYPSVSTLVLVVVDDSFLYRPNSTSGSQKVNITNGVGIMQLSCEIGGTVRLYTIDYAGLNIVDTALNVTFPITATAIDNPPSGGAYVTGTMTLIGIPCSDFGASMLAAVVSTLHTSLDIPEADLIVLQATCGTGASVFARRSTSTSVNLGELT